MGRYDDFRAFSQLFDCLHLCRTDTLPGESDSSLLRLQGLLCSRTHSRQYSTLYWLWLLNSASYANMRVAYA